MAAGAFARLGKDSSPADYLFRAHPDPTLYAAQHRSFTAALQRHVPVIRLADVVADSPVWAHTATSPNQVFTRDSLITLPWTPEHYIRARMRPPPRRGESDTMEAAVRRLGLTELVRLPEHVFVEGGDVVPFSRGGRRTLLVGHGPRSSRSGALALRDALVPDHADEVIAIRLADWRMNLDGGFLPVAEDVVLAERACVLAAERLDRCGERAIDLWETIDGMGVRVIAVSRGESIHQQACNAVCLGERRIVCYDLCTRVLQELRAHGVETLAVPGSELVKGRGGPRCMSRPLYATPHAGSNPLPAGGS